MLGVMEFSAESSCKHPVSLANTYSQMSCPHNKMRMQAKLPRQHGRIMHNPANQEVKRMTRGTRPKEQLKAEKPQECKTTRGMISLKCGEV
jgi:hypothetical protein